MTLPLNIITIVMQFMLAVDHVALANSCKFASTKFNSLNMWQCVFAGHRVSSQFVEKVGLYKNARVVGLANCPYLTDAGLKHLAKLHQLQHLDLRWCGKITDAGLKHLAKLHQLQHLDLDGCEKITDAGLKQLVGIQSLGIIKY